MHEYMLPLHGLSALLSARGVLSRLLHTVQTSIGCCAGVTEQHAVKLTTRSTPKTPTSKQYAQVELSGTPIGATAMQRPRARAGARRDPIHVGSHWVDGPTWALAIGKAAVHPRGIRQTYRCAHPPHKFARAGNVEPLPPGLPMGDNRKVTGNLHAFDNI